MSEEIAARLRAAGMSAAEARAKGALFEKAASRLDEFHGPGQSPHHAVFAPGRIEVLGKHTDYAGGRSLLAAAERGICLVAAQRSDALIRISDAQQDLDAELALSPDLPPAPTEWMNYPITVVRRVARNFPEAHTGADIAFASDLPAAAGLSSSSALIIAIFLALAEINALDQSAAYKRNLHNLQDLATYLASIENGQGFGTLASDSGVGTTGGSEDHIAILCCRSGHLCQYSFNPPVLEKEIPLPSGLTFVIGVSGITAEKARTALEKYNRASRIVQEILGHWRAATRRKDASLAAAVASAPDASERLRSILLASNDPQYPAHVLVDRLDQFVAESNTIIPAASDALGRGDLRKFGQLVERSQTGAEWLLGNQVPETIELARSARVLGAAAASAFGAGFGGSVWALIRDSQAEEFRALWRERYHQTFPERARLSEFLITAAGPAAQRL